MDITTKIANARPWILGLVDEIERSPDWAASITPTAESMCDRAPLEAILQRMDEKDYDTRSLIALLFHTVEATNWRARCFAAAVRDEALELTTEQQTISRSSTREALNRHGGRLLLHDLDLRAVTRLAEWQSADYFHGRAVLCSAIREELEVAQATVQGLLESFARIPGSPSTFTVDDSGVTRRVSALAKSLGPIADSAARAFIAEGAVRAHIASGAIRPD